MSNTILNIRIDKIKESPYQGRLMSDEDQDDLNDVIKLAESIRQNDLMVPIIVRPVGDEYELIDGHRRLAAFKYLKRDTIPALIKNYDNRMAQVFSVVGNLERKNLTTIELAVAYKKILDAGIYKNKKELSQALSKDVTYVGDVLNALKMDKRILNYITKNKTKTDVRLLRMIRQVQKINPAGYADKQWALFQKVVNDNISRAELAGFVKQEKQIKKIEKLKIKFGERDIKINIYHGKLNIDQKITIRKLVDKKLNDLIKQIDYITN